MSNDDALRKLLERPGLSTRTVERESGCSRTRISQMQRGLLPVAPEVMSASRRVALREIIGTAQVLFETLEDSEDDGAAGDSAGR